MNKLYILLIIPIIYSCAKDKPIEPEIDITKGFFIVNEGNFTWGNSSLSFFNENNNSIKNDIFFSANQTILGDVAMDMKIIHNKGFIVVNNSGLIYIINPSNSKHIATIGSLVSPRYVLPVNDSIAYVTDLYSPYITLIHTKKMSKYGQIIVGNSTEAMVKVQDKVYVTSWSFKEKVYVIDCIQHKLLDSIKVGKQPQSIVADKNGYVWILCDGGYSGNPIGHEPPSLWKVNSQTNQVEKIIHFPSKQFHARSLTINKTQDTLAFIWKHVYRMSVSDTIFPTNSFITSAQHNFYSLYHHPIKPWLIVSDAKNYVSNGNIMVYNLNGILLFSKEAGIIPSAFCYYQK